MQEGFVVGAGQLDKERYMSQKCLRGTDRISDVAWEVGAILQPEKESFAFR
jgi:hypothetical protein